MKNAAFYGKNGMKMEEHPTPDATKGKALIKVKASGICGGEYNTYRHKEHIPVPDQGIILGHEVVGEVIKPAGQLRAGELVAVSPNSGCNTCWYCRHGLTYECRNKPVHTAKTGGGYAEYLVTEPEQCYVLPEGTSVINLAMAEPLACCIHSVRRIQIGLGDRVAILGAGGGAQLFIQLAHLQGAAEVTVYDDMEERLALARSMGADRVIHTAQMSGQSELKQADYDVVIVTRSSAGFFEQAMMMCGWRGRILCYGVASPEILFRASPRLIWQKQISIVGSRSFEGDAFETAVKLLISGRIRPELLINRIIPLEQAEWALKNPQGQIKTVIVPEIE